MNKIILSILIILFFIYIGICDPPVNPDDFPTEVRDDWEAVNQLRELPEPNLERFFLSCFVFQTDITSTV